MMSSSSGVSSSTVSSSSPGTAYTRPHRKAGQLHSQPTTSAEGEGVGVAEAEAAGVGEAEATTTGVREAEEPTTREGERVALAATTTREGEGVAETAGPTRRIVRISISTGLGRGINNSMAPIFPKLQLPEKSP